MLEFNEEKHEYTLEGNVLPSVTQIMEPINRAKYSHIDPDTLKRAADRGTEIHAAIEYLIKYNVEEINPDYQMYLEAFKKWASDYNPEYIESEMRMYHPKLMYAGTMDLLCKINNRLIIVDFKTTASTHTESWMIQMEAYAQMAKANGFEIRGKQILVLKPDGNYQVINLPADDGVSWRVFGACQVVNNFVRSVGK